jgi:hypothetical protein
LDLTRDAWISTATPWGRRNSQSLRIQARTGPTIGLRLSPSPRCGHNFPRVQVLANRHVSLCLSCLWAVLAFRMDIRCYARSDNESMTQAGNRSFPPMALQDEHSHLHHGVILPVSSAAHLWMSIILPVRRTEYALLTCKQVCLWQCAAGTAQLAVASPHHNQDE